MRQRTALALAFALSLSASPLLPARAGRAAQAPGAAITGVTVSATAAGPLGTAVGVAVTVANNHASASQ